MTDTRPSYLIQSVSRASRILEEVAARPEGLTARHIAARCKLNLATTYHLLRTLRYEHYVSRGPGGRYILGPKIASQFRDLLAAMERPPEIGEVLRHLADTTGQSAYYGRIIGGQLVLTDVVEGPYSPHLEELMVRFDEAAHATALGKALLWTLPREERLGHLHQRGLRPFTNNTVVDPEKLDHELRELAPGHVFTEQEQYRDNVCCGAVLVGNDETSGAIAMPYSVERWRRLETRLTRQLLRVAADTCRQWRRHYSSPSP